MALMTAIGVLLSFIEFPLLPGVTWLKFDASNMPAMVAGFAYGPGGGVAVGILTAILHGLLMADFSGAVMNIIVVLFYVLPAALIYKRMHTFAGAITRWSLARCWQLSARCSAIWSSRPHGSAYRSMP